MQFTLHRQCNFAADTGCAFAPDRAMTTTETGDGEGVDGGNGGNGGNGGENEEDDGTLRIHGLEIGPLYDCDEADDAECDLCGRPGGILQFFDVDPAHSSLPPPGEEVRVVVLRAWSRPPSREPPIDIHRIRVLVRVRVRVRVCVCVRVPVCE